MDGKKLINVIRNILEREGKFCNDNNVVTKLSNMTQEELYNILFGFNK